MRNGAGKSTTMRLIPGLGAPTAGTVTVNGRRYQSMRQPLHEVGSLLEAAAVHPGRSARGHLLALARANGIGPNGPMRCSAWPVGWTPSPGSGPGGSRSA